MKCFNRLFNESSKYQELQKIIYSSSIERSKTSIHIAARVIVMYYRSSKATSMVVGSWENITNNTSQS